MDVKIINASINDNKISVDGTVNNGVLAVAILVYEEDGTTLVTMATTSVDSNDKYSDTIDVTPGKKYIVKAANYDGIITWIVIVLVSVSGIVVTIVYRKKKNI